MCSMSDQCLFRNEISSHTTVLAYNSDNDHLSYNNKERRILAIKVVFHYLLELKELGLTYGWLILPDQKLQGVVSASLIFFSVSLDGHECDGIKSQLGIACHYILRIR